MNTNQILRLRAAIASSFGQREGIFASCDWFYVEGAPSPLASPPDNSDEIISDGLFLSLMGDDRPKVRGEIVTGQARNNKFFVFFQSPYWHDLKARQFTHEMGLKETYAFFETESELRRKAKEAFTRFQPGSEHVACSCETAGSGTWVRQD
jgi:hypothetical protein